MWSTALLTSLALVGPLVAQEPGPTAAAAVVRGRVLDSLTSEPLGNVLVAVRAQDREVVTDGGGSFILPGLAPGAARLHERTVGYGTVEKVLLLEAGQALTIEIVLNPEGINRAEGVVVTAGAFDRIEVAGGTEHTLSVGEIKNLASVLAEDPLRAVHSLPGVATGDDFHSTFASRGLGFGAAGVYIDGVLTTAPFHTVREEESLGGSITILSGNLIESLSLISGGAPARYGDRIGPVLSLRTREGGERLAGRLNMSLAGGASATLEGPWGRSDRGSWLFSARKSYLDYVVRRVFEDTPLVAYYDVQGKLSYRPSKNHRLSFFALYGDFDYEERDTTGEGLLDETGANADTALAKLQWDWFFGGAGSFTSSAFGTVEKGTNRNSSGDRLARFGAKQAGFRADLAYPLAHDHRVEAGVLWRRLDEDEVRFRPRAGAAPLDVSEEYGASSAQPGAYVQDAWALAGGRVLSTMGLRTDRLSATGQSLWLPRASVMLKVLPRTTVTLNAGDYGQFPRLMQRFGPRGNLGLQPERARQLGLGLERTFGERTRLRVEVYDHQIRDGLFTARRDTRIEGAYVIPGDDRARFGNALEGHSRGFEVLLQRRSANNLSGWVSYAFGTARLRDDDSPDGSPFDADFDQRHTLNLYGSGRLSRSVNVSSKFRYGSGFPLAGFFREAPSGLQLGGERNGVRQRAYARWDVRVNKALDVRGSKLTLYAEVMNVLDRQNLRLDWVDEDFFTRTAVAHEETLFPRLPAIGATLEF